MLHIHSVVSLLFFFFFGSLQCVAALVYDVTFA